MRKIAAIIGTTGVGKSQLAVELCKSLKGQVINADAMQVYKGLDIITNKMPAHERQNIRHHLIDFLEPEQEYQVTEFTRDASECIAKICSEQQLPVIVGGTNYYIQSLLWYNMLLKENGSRSPSPELSPELDQLDTAELYKRLQQVDPVMANRWHPSDRRKIRRSLQIFYETGRPQSELLKEQKEQHETHGMKPRYESLIFWLYADPSKLNPRLDERVDKMIETGLFDEIRSLRQRVIEGSVKLPGQNLEKYQRGLWQAIGYKEFDPYFTAIESNKHSEEEISKVKQECTERMKSATRRYAKRQVQWIRNKLLPTIWKSEKVHIYLLDATDLDAWDENVRKKAIDVAKAFCDGLALPDPSEFGETAATLLSKTDTLLDSQTRALDWKKHVCPVCRTSTGESLVLNGDLEWKQHLASRGHRKSLKRSRQDEQKRVKARVDEPSSESNIDS